MKLHRSWLVWLALLVVPATFARSPTVASLNLCADQFVLLLADRDQILTVTHLSHETAGSYYFEQARRYPANQGGSEQVLGLSPDVVIAGQYTSVHSVRLLNEIGLNVKTIPIVDDVDTLFSTILDVAGWLGQQPRGKAIVAELKRRIAEIPPASGVKPLAAVFDPNGYTTGADTLRGRLLLLAGFENAATRAGIERYGQLTLEQILHLSPDALVDSPYSPGTYSRGQLTSRHPALMKSGISPHIISIPSRMTVCAGPWTIDVLERLYQERVRLQSIPVFEAKQ